MRFSSDSPMEINHGYRIHAVPALGYRRNVSFARLRDHRAVAGNLRRAWIREKNRPDVIVASYPTIDSARAGVSYGAEIGVPTIVDVRDQWPDTFLDVFPSSVQAVAGLALSPIRVRANNVLRNASALTANGPQVIDWAVKRSGRRRGERDRYFPMSYPDTSPSKSQLENAVESWRERGVRETDFLVVFVGTIGRHFEFQMILEAARILHAQGADVKFVICGDGQERVGLMRQAQDLPNMLFPGWIDYPEIHVLLRWATLGLAPYKSTPNFRDGVPNKPVEYLSASLPVLMPFKQGHVWELMERSGCGIVYGRQEPQTMVDEILAIYHNEQGLHQMRQSASRLFSRYFSFDAVHDAMISHIEEVAHA